MDFKLSPDQVMLQDAMKRMVEREINPILHRHDREQPLPKDATMEIIRICARQGLTAARIPEKDGGAGLSALTWGIMLEQLPAEAAFMVGGNEVTATRIYMGGTPEQRERFLPDLLEGRKMACTGTTEPDAGSDPRSIRTRAEIRGDRVIVNGTKSWVTGASICDVMMVTASVGKDARGLANIIRVVVDQDESPFQQRKLQTLGLRQGHLGEATFVDCRVPTFNIIGQEGDASRVLTETWLAQRAIMGLYTVRMAQTALDASLKYAGERVMFGRKIGGFQLVQQLLADIATAVTTSRLLCYYALAAVDNGERANQVTAMAKRYAVDACTRAISLAMEVHGAMGISSELGLERLYRDARMFPIPDGTNQILTLIEGRELTGIPAYR